MHARTQREVTLIVWAPDKSPREEFPEPDGDSQGEVLRGTRDRRLQGGWGWFSPALRCSVPPDEPKVKN